MSQTPLTPDEFRRYQRHLVLPGFGIGGQQKLKAASILVVGAGGLGCPLLLYLAAAGVGRIGIVDDDVVDETNLQRQVLYTTADVGRKKAEVAAERLQALNPFLQVDVFPIRLTRNNALDLLSRYDLVADGADNFATRYLVNDAAVLTGIPNVFASIFRWEGQVSVFNHLRGDGTRGPNYRDLYPTPPSDAEVLSCAEGGVLGVLPGILGSMQAAEVIKLITGTGEVLDGRMCLLDVATFTTREIRFAPDPGNPLTGTHPVQTGLIDYEIFCGVKQEQPHELTLDDLREWTETNRPFQLIDVREHHEHALRNIGGKCLPLSILAAEMQQISRDLPVILHCQTGKRSRQAKELLLQAGYTHVFTLHVDWEQAGSGHPR